MGDEMGKEISYRLLLVKLDVVYGDGIFLVDDAMRYQKKVSGSKPKWKDPVPDYIYTYLDEKYGVSI